MSVFVSAFVSVLWNLTRWCWCNQRPRTPPAFSEAWITLSVRPRTANCQIIDLMHNDAMTQLGTAGGEFPLIQVLLGQLWGQL